MNLPERCKAIEFILSDVDGVLTDGGIIFDNQGIETKRFQTRDGLGIKLWRKAGYGFGLLTARTSHIVKLRAAELGVDVLRQGFEDKLPAAQQLFDDLNLDPAAVCYIGDDLPDLPVIRFVGLGVAVADAAPEVCSHADHVTTLPGGRGAVRETVEFILQTQGRWDDLVRKYAED
jgi:YrbI family 3-deoxy-D-manno-octulosonate 8-phosphate phosphatase